MIGAAVGAAIAFFLFPDDEKAGESKKDAVLDLKPKKKADNTKKDETE